MCEKYKTSCELKAGGGGEAWAALAMVTLHKGYISSFLLNQLSVCLFPARKSGYMKKPTNAEI